MAGIIINIDKALEQRTQFNILREPLNELLRERQEEFEKNNPLQYFYTTRSMNVYQESFTSNIGFDNAFVETNDFALGPIFNTEEGFSATYRTRTFQGSFIITQQVLEDEAYSRAADLAKQFTKRWQGNIVEYGMSAMQSGFGETVIYGKEQEGKSYLRLTSADTPDGDIHNEKHNPLFTNKHTIVRRDDMTDADIEAAYQSNCFYAENINITGSSPDRISALADAINQIITIQENYKDDNGKYAGVDGAKLIVACNDPHLKASINNALSLDMFKQGDSFVPNPAYQRATAVFTPYLNDIPCTAEGKGFFIVDASYNAENHGPEFTERIPFTLNVTEQQRPQGIIYDGRQRFDINCASWRGVTYVSLVEPDGETDTWNDKEHFTTITPISTIVTPISIVGTVQTA